MFLFIYAVDCLIHRVLYCGTSQVIKWPVFESSLSRTQQTGHMRADRGNPNVSNTPSLHKPYLHTLITSIISTNSCSALGVSWNLSGLVPHTCFTARPIPAINKLMRFERKKNVSHFCPPICFGKFTLVIPKLCPGA